MKTLYFAYGSNMDEQQMAQRCPGAEVVSTAVLPGYRFIIYHRGYATLLAEKGAQTPGLLWRIDPHHEAALDRYEGYPMGLYDKCVRRVTMEDEAETEALVYIDHDNLPLGAPRDGYLERIVAAAQARNFSESQVLLLRAWPRAKTFRAWNQMITWMKSGAPDSVSFPFAESLGCGWHRSFQRDCRREAAQWLRDRRDAIILRALESYCAADDEDFGVERLAHGADAQEGFIAFLLEMAFSEAQEQAAEFDAQCRGELAQIHVGLSRLLQRAKALADAQTPLEMLEPYPGKEEIATRGAVITRDPERDRYPEDRFVVTEHAGTLAGLWRYLFFPIDTGLHANPRDARFLDAFADAAEQTDADGPEAAVRRTLGYVTEMAYEKMGELEQVLDTL